MIADTLHEIHRLCQEAADLLREVVEERRLDVIETAEIQREVRTLTVLLSKCLDGGPKTMQEIEMSVIYQALEKHNGDKTKAASELGIAVKTLYNKLKKYKEAA